LWVRFKEDSLAALKRNVEIITVGNKYYKKIEFLLPSAYQPWQRPATQNP